MSWVHAALGALGGYVGAKMLGSKEEDVEKDLLRSMDYVQTCLAIAEDADSDPDERLDAAEDALYTSESVIEAANKSGLTLIKYSAQRTLEEAQEAVDELHGLGFSR